MQLTQLQQKALANVKVFLKDKDQSVFILKGYAGTGKTTLIQSIIPIIKSIGKTVWLMAPTGRAARILEERASSEGNFIEASTIHKAIYELVTIDSKEYDKEGRLINAPKFKTLDRANGVDDFQILFKVKALQTAPDKNVFIVDESSLISSRKTTNEILRFGTDVVLDDLLTFANPLKGGKIIFVGDPAQLHPVGDNKSAALDETYFLDKGLKTSSFELTEVLRQAGGSTILKNAMKVRQLMTSEYKNELVFDRVPNEVEDIDPPQIVSHFVEKQPKPTIGNSIVICFSNNKAHEYNNAIRHKYFQNVEAPQPGDIVQIVKNNYLYGLMNGDFAQIIDVSDFVETQTASVWSTINGDRQRVTINLQFRNVTLLRDDNNQQLKCKIVETLLNNPQASLSPLEMTALYVNFLMRYRGMEVEKGPSFWRDNFLTDPYYNALNVKYGYAITGHKAQGGDWDTAYVNYSGRTGLDEDSLRWNYTATTRAIKHLYGVNMPKITPFTQLKFGAIKQTNKQTKDALSLADLGKVEMLPPNATNAQKAKYKSASSQLKLIGLNINRVDVFPYKDRYCVDTPKGELKFDCTYNASGIYTKYVPLQENDLNTDILQALHSECEYDYEIKYTPTTPFLEDLHYRICSLCDELGITITNIVLQESSYKVIYHLKTSGTASSIQFSYTAKGFVSYALPLSDMGKEDEKLNLLINRMQ